MDYKEPYLEAIKKKNYSKPLLTQVNMALKRLTVGDLLAVNLAFIRLHEPCAVNEDTFLTALVFMHSAYSVGNDAELLPLYDINTAKLDEVVTIATTTDFQPFHYFPDIMGDYNLARLLLYTSPVPTQQKPEQLSPKEQSRLFKNNFIVTDSMIRTYQIENKTDIMGMPLIDFAVIIGALTIQGGATIAERVATSLRLRLESIAYLVAVADIHTYPRTAQIGPFAKLNNGDYFQPTPKQAILQVRSAKDNEVLNKRRQQMGIMAKIKIDNPDSYKEKLAPLTERVIRNNEIILEGKPEYKIIEMIRQDWEALKNGLDTDNN